MRGVLIALASLAACAPAGDGVGPDTDVVAPCDAPGAICTVAGQPGRLGSNGDGLPALETMLYFPSALAWSPAGRLVLDDFNNHRIRELGDDGRLVAIAGVGLHGWAVEGPALASPLENPVDIAFLADGTLVIDELHTGRLLGVKDGALTILAGTGDEGFFGDGGPALQAVFDNPAGLAAGPDGALYVADTNNHCVRVVRDGVVERLAGDGQMGVDDGAGGPRFKLPQHVRVDAARGRLIVADAGNHLVRAIDLDSRVVTTLAGTGEDGSDGDGGPATAARLRQPWGVAVDADGGVLVADFGAHVVRRIDPDGTIGPFAGTGTKGFSGDEGPATEAALDSPADVLVGPDGAVYVADMFNGVVRRVAP